MSTPESDPKSHEPRVMGLDIGTSRIKAVCLDGGGHVVAGHAVATPWVRRKAGVEMSPTDFLAAIRGLLSAFGPVQLAAVRAFGVSSMGEVGTLVEPDRYPVLPIIGWHDGRGAETVRELQRAFPDDLRSATGRPIRPVSTVAKLGWLRDAGAGLDGTWVGVAGLVAWALCGRAGQDASLAATTGAFDPYRCAYVPEVWAAAGLRDLTLAPVLAAGEPVGLVSASGAAQSGLPVGVPVVIAGHDHLVGAYGSGLGRGEVLDSVGSGEALLAVVDRPPREVPRTLATNHLTVTRWPLADRLAVVWEELRPGMAMSRLAAAMGWPREELEKAARVARPSEPADRAFLEAWESATGELPQTPWPLDPGRTWAWVLEGYADAAAAIERRVRSATGSDGRTLVIGGGLRSTRWMQAKSRRATHGLDVVAVEEGVARGAALVAGSATSWWPLSNPPVPARRPLATGEEVSDSDVRHRS